MSKSKKVELSIEYVDVKDLIPYTNNAKQHPEEQIDQIAASIKEFSMCDPIAVDNEMVIIEGHGRLLALQKLGIKTTPIIKLGHLTEYQRKAYIIAHNKLTMNSGFDIDTLVNELHFLDDGFDLELTGFSEDELDALFFEEPEGLTDEDEVPDTPDKAITKLGDVWILGDHRLMCGDSTDADTVTKLLNKTEPHLMVTDPPYGVEYDPNWRNEADRSNGKKIGARAVNKVNNDNRSDWSEAWELFPGNIAYVWHAGKFAGIVQDSLERCGLEIRSQIIWAKQHFAISRGDYHWQHEPCWYAVKKKGNWTGDRKQTTIWNIDKPVKSETGHSTQKPVECMRRPMINNSSIGQIIYDPFLGSGTTIIAAETEGRICYGLELEPAYCEVIIQRWQNFTGKSAILEATGEDYGGGKDKTDDRTKRVARV